MTLDEKTNGLYCLRVRKILTQNEIDSIIRENQIIKDVREMNENRDRQIRRRDEVRKNLGAPEGKYIVVGWNPANPEKSVPCPVAKPYSVLNFAEAYAAKRNKDWENERDKARAAGKEVPEEDYFVMDDQGRRIC